MDLRASMSVPPGMQPVDKLKHFKRTDSSESSNSSLASFGGGLSAIINRATNGSRKKHHLRPHSTDRSQSPLGQVSHPPMERNDSGQSVVSRGYTVPAGEVTVISTGGNVVPAAQGGVVINGEEVKRKTDEVAIVVASGRKNSTTKAVR